MISAVQYLWIRRDLVTNILSMDNAEPDGAIFYYIVGCCKFTEAKSRELCTVLQDKGLFLKN